MYCLVQHQVGISQRFPFARPKNIHLRFSEELLVLEDLPCARRRNVVLFICSMKLVTGAACVVTIATSQLYHGFGDSNGSTGVCFVYPT